MAKTLSLVLGIILVLVGLLGFVGNPLFGDGALFETNLTHDLVHLVTGLILLAVAFWAASQAGMWLKILGVVYLIVAALGFLMASPILGLIEVNGADNVFHVLLGIVLLGGGFLGKGGAAPSMGSGMNTPPMGGAGPAGQPPQQM